MARPDRLADDNMTALNAILAAPRELAAVTASVRGFADIMNERRGRKLLEPWMTAALATGEPPSAPSSPACGPTRTLTNGPANWIMGAEEDGTHVALQCLNQRS